MTTLKFADTHNMVVFLSKPTESEGFEQIVDFLNANPIKYALTINPTIYTSCIEQFWATVKAKTINKEVQLQALVDRKKVIITESTIKRDLQLEDAEGADCLPNATIFEQLTLMGHEKISQNLAFYKAFFFPQWKFLIHTILQCLSAKTPSWNEFSSTMASAIICLATIQKFKFSKYIFESMVKNLDNVGKFLMYPRFIQVFLDKQLEGGPTHNRTYIAPSHTNKIFGNIRRVGKGFSERETLLFQTMVVQDQADIAYEVVNEEMVTGFLKRCHYATSLDAEQDIGYINKHNPRQQLTEPSSWELVLGTSSGSVQAHQETMGYIIAQTSNLQQMVLDLETTNTTQGNEIASLRRRVKSRKEEIGQETHKFKSIYRVGSSRRVESFEDEDMFGVNDLDGDEVIVDNVDVVKTAEETRSVVEEVTVVIEKAKLVSAAEETVNALLQTVTLAELKSTKPKADKEQAPTPTVSSQQPSQVKVQDKGKGKMVEPEPAKKMSKKDQLMLDEELAFKLQAEMEALKSLKNKSFANIQELFEKAMKRVNTFCWTTETELVEDELKKVEARDSLREQFKKEKEKSGIR
ncbi:hypothetical protein Tco_1053820 [Tanacetum coccineum]|uniref:Transposase n=1 Tax=Tanacetum coccineum TaxID=301880 RepID=A0ABQ5GXG5_9ASTR